MHRLPYLAQPVQMIWGERAVLALPRLPSIASQMHVDTISGSNVFPHEEQPEKVVACILAHEAKKPNSLQPASMMTIMEPQSAVADNSVAGMKHVEESGEQEATTTSSTEVETVVPATESAVMAGQSTGEEAITALEGVTAYCFKCKQKRAIQNAQRITTPKGRRAMEGTCPVCGTRLFRFVAG
jgi:hypothetical protein